MGRGREKVVRTGKPKAQIESRVNLSGLMFGCGLGGWCFWVGGVRFRLDHSSGERRRGAWISLAQDERFRLDRSSGERQRGAWISLAQGERFLLDYSSGREERRSDSSIAGRNVPLGLL
ncbi:hypothetical protein J6590_084728 [Homalodisca vitripennis]|nr:hypothetical protein J6590_084728 [Homalodisca vitripennis]